MTSMQADQPTNNIIDLYVVQRCWFSGPKTFAPVEYARLFPTAADAERLAYQSAHAFAQQHQEPVRTLQLQSGGTSYGFVAAGSLFWIRPVKALLVVDDECSLASRTGSGDCTQGGAHALLASNQHTLWSPAGINARRINIVSAQHPPTVFLGSSSSSSSSSSWSCAQQFASAMQQQQQQQVRVAWLPIGRPPVDSWWSEWPDKCVSESIFQQQQQQQDANKRMSCGDDKNTVFTKNHADDVDSVGRPTKRQNRVESSSSMTTMEWQ